MSWLAGINRKVQIKQVSDDGVRIILKWGGVLTHAGAAQAEELGRVFRSTMYPSESLGLLRLHSTYRHDLKIYSSDEGRVQMTAASFTKGLLDLEGDLTPILASLVRAFNTNAMLDDTLTARDMMDDIKRRIKVVVTRQAAKEKDSDAAVSAAAGSAGVPPLTSPVLSTEESSEVGSPVPDGLTVSVGVGAGDSPPVVPAAAQPASGSKRALNPVQTIEQIIDEIVPLRPLAAMKCLEARAGGGWREGWGRRDVVVHRIGCCDVVVMCRACSCRSVCRACAGCACV